MINIKKKSLCCGCGACAQVCPKQCIMMAEDNEGFLYPQVDKLKCIDCGLCDRVCPEMAAVEARKPLGVFAAKHQNEEIRKSSSSGGIFTLLAEKVLAEKGVVFGARFSEGWAVVHDYVETIEKLDSFRGSKYLQSVIGGNYKKAEQFLKEGRKVLFSGTPCQIAGLKKYLRKEYENLLTVDFVCHGVPSPKVWKIYLQDTVEKIAPQGDSRKNTVSTTSKNRLVLIGVDFRGKSTGWKKYSFTLHLAEANAEGEKNTVSHSHPYYKNPFMQSFLADLILRPSCYECPSKAGRSGSDITIGDFWGIERLKPEIDDDRGLSLVLVHNPQYYSFIKDISLCEFEYRDAVGGNPSLEKSVARPLYRDVYMRKILRKNRFVQYKPTRVIRFAERVRRVLKRKLGI